MDKTTITSSDRRSNSNPCFRLVAVTSLIATIVLGAARSQGLFSTPRSLRLDPNTLVTNVDNLPAVVDDGSIKTTTLSTGSTTTTTSSIPPLKLPQTLLLQSSSSSSPFLTTTEPAGYRHPASYFSDAYTRRALSSRFTSFVADWGSWTFVDPNPSHRLAPDELEALLLKYPNRDIPRADFPRNAWQVDPTYLEPWLQQSIALTERSLLAILAEWGHYDIKSSGGDVDIETAMQDADNTQNAFMFNLSILPFGEGYPKRQVVGNAGYASPTAMKRLKRLLLHSIMTQDQFLVSMGGHSSAAAHGNHYQQSYTLQIQQTLEPILARLGVFHVCRNIGMGGLGTIHNSLGSQSIYGGDSAVLIWDSSMTESDFAFTDVFVRQGVLGGDRVPMFAGSPDNGYYDHVTTEFGVWNVGQWGTGQAGTPKTETATQVDQIPYAARYLECSEEMNPQCNEHKYNGVCWIDRPDFTPKTEQKSMGGRVKWHPGNTYHQRFSRFYLYNILKVLREGLIQWKNSTDFALPDEEWHLTNIFETIRGSIKSQGNETGAKCFKLGLPDIVCQVPFSARSEFTPRANTPHTSIRSILYADVDVPDPMPNSYDPPDVLNPALFPPDGEIDIVAIVESGNDFKPNLKRRQYLQTLLAPVVRPSPSTQVSGLAPGKGWDTLVAPAADNCDGTYDSFCHRGAENSCLLYAHNDFRGHLVGDALSGWLIMTLKDVRHGVIMIRSLYTGDVNKRTVGWKCENNAATCDNPLTDEQATKAISPAKYCGITFEYAINGKITTWNADDYKNYSIPVARLVDPQVLLNDQTLIPEGQTADVELAIRIGGNCGRSKVIGLSHVYWA